MRIGVDTGGTFTDCVVLEGGEVKVLKVFSTPADASSAIVQGVRQLAGDKAPARRGGRGSDVRKGREAALARLEVIHGTTVGTNSLLERRGARVALVTTAGFEDLLEIGRQARPRLYDLNVQREPPLAPRARRFGVKGENRARWQNSPSYFRCGNSPIIIAGECERGGFHRPLLPVLLRQPRA